jgi:hypothetical protein
MAASLGSERTLNAGADYLTHGQSVMLSMLPQFVSDVNWHAGRDNN